MFEGILQAMTNPKALFEDFEHKPSLINLAVVVVLLSAVVGAIGAYLSALPTVDAFGDQNPFGKLGLILTPVSVVIFSFIIWLVNGLLIRMAAGMDAKPWAIAAYSFAPSILLSTIIIVLAAIFPTQLTPVSFDASNPDAIRQASNAVQQEFQQSFLGRSSTIINYIGVAWSLLIIFLGVRVSADTNKAIVSTVLVGVLSLGFILLPFLLNPTG